MAFGARWDGGLVGTWTPIYRAGSAPAMLPAQAGVWAASTIGDGVRTLTWRPAQGEWTVVMMRADGAPGVAARVQVGATLPGLGWIGAGLLGAGVFLLVVGGLLIGVAVDRASRPILGGSVSPGGDPGRAFRALRLRQRWMPGRVRDIARAAPERRHAIPLILDCLAASQTAQCAVTASGADPGSPVAG
jgi:hypothetical protein